MDKFECMRAFTRVVETGGFAAAARELELSRSAVSKLVIQLENNLGAQLLHRTTRHVSPTETGLAFYERCVRILADLEEAERAISNLHEEPRGTLKINAPMSFGTLYLGSAVADFMTRYPDLQVQLTLDDRFVDPIEEGYDVVVRIAQPSEWASLIVCPIAPAPRILCASSSYLQKYGTPHHPEELRNHSCLHYGYLATRNHWILHGLDGEYRVPIRSMLCSNNGEVLRDAAMCGLGIALLPAFIVSHDLQEGRLQSVLPDYHPPEIVISVIYPVNRHLSAKVQLLTEFLQARFDNLSES
ncbi:MAG: LysR substrate-binding domain-containing protein [Elainellaceae cyanobacterium]